METIRIYKTVKEDGEIYINNIPYKKGSKVILVIKPASTDRESQKFTARDLLESNLVGMWENRKDIPKDSSKFARILRKKSQRSNIK